LGFVFYRKLILFDFRERFLGVLGLFFSLGFNSSLEWPLGVEVLRLKGCWQTIAF
jgi:hypothetical protein